MPYGYEITLSGLDKKLQERGTDQSGDTISKIRASPDLLVYCPRKPVDDQYFELAELRLLEVKTRKTFGKTPKFQLYDEKKIERIDNYKKFWGESFLTVAIPWGNIFYIQKMKKLKILNTYEATQHFRKFQEIFEVQNDVLKYFQSKAKQIMDIFLT